MGFLSNSNRLEETDFFVDNVEDAPRRNDPQWTSLSAPHMRKAVEHLMTIQKINAVDEITASGCTSIAEKVAEVKRLYDRDGHTGLSQSCQFIPDCCYRYLAC